MNDQFESVADELDFITNKMNTLLFISKPTEPKQLIENVNGVAPTKTKIHDVVLTVDEADGAKFAPEVCYWRKQRLLRMVKVEGDITIIRTGKDGALEEKRYNSLHIHYNHVPGNRMLKLFEELGVYLNHRPDLGLFLVDRIIIFGEIIVYDYDGSRFLWNIEIQKPIGLRKVLPRI